MTEVQGQPVEGGRMACSGQRMQHGGRLPCAQPACSVTLRSRAAAAAAAAAFCAAASWIAAVRGFKGGAAAIGKWTQSASSKGQQGGIDEVQCFLALRLRQQHTLLPAVAAAGGAPNCACHCGQCSHGMHSICTPHPCPCLCAAVAAALVDCQQCSQLLPAAAALDARGQDAGSVCTAGASCMALSRLCV